MGFAGVNKLRQKTGPSYDLPRVNQALVLLSIVFPFFACIIAAVALSEGRVSRCSLLLTGIFYFLTILGITAGFHRLYSHRSFESGVPLRILLGVLGSMAVQGPLIKWVASHRQHHQNSDRDGDPHSPVATGNSLHLLCRLWHAHTGWLFSDYGRSEAYVRDLMKDRIAVWLSHTFPVWVLLSLLLPAAVAFLVGRTPEAVWQGLLWGGLVRIFLAHHMTWSVNSICHLWGTRNFQTSDNSRNNLLCAIVTLGEGWHNCHHAFPTSAKHGLLSGQIDITYLTLKALEKCGLVWGLKLPDDSLLHKHRC